MKILLISDEESAYLWDHYQPGRLEGIDLILSCGDLSPEYLSFLVTMSTAPVFYIHGNHDGKYALRPPEGCECIEDRIVNFGGLRQRADQTSRAQRLHPRADFLTQG